jgi:hypothetical protein
MGGPTAVKALASSASAASPVGDCAWPVSARQGTGPMRWSDSHRRGSIAVRLRDSRGAAIIEISNDSRPTMR